MAIEDTEKLTQILRKKPNTLADYEAMKLSISELRIPSNKILFNPAISSVNGVAVWGISVKSPDVMVQIQEVATNSPVITPYEVENLGNSEYQLKIYFNTSRLTLEANTYKAIVIGGGVKESLVEE